MKRVTKLYTKNPLRIVGLMSGTSMDGLDICVADIDCSSFPFSVNILIFNTIPFPKPLRSSIQNSLSGSTELICMTHYVLGRYYAKQIKNFLFESGIDGVDAVGIHGQTIHHISGEATLQIGEPSFIAELCRVPVVSDFRARDISVGGTGAPLIPFVDQCLFQQSEKSVITLNLGGIANITYLPSLESKHPIVGFDTGPGMSLMDETAEMFGIKTAKIGQMILSGIPHRTTVLKWMKEYYIQKDPPKSTGRDYFGKTWIKKNVPQIEQWKIENLLATLSLFTVHSIVVNCNKFTHLNEVSHVIVSGGGVHNQGVMKMLEKEFSPLAVFTSNKFGIDADIKEALGFAILTAAYFKGIPTNIPSVTGASRSVILGKLTI